MSIVFVARLTARCFSLVCFGLKLESHFASRWFCDANLSLALLSHWSLSLAERRLSRCHAHAQCASCNLPAKAVNKTNLEIDTQLHVRNLTAASMRPHAPDAEFVCRLKSHRCSVHLFTCSVKRANCVVLATCWRHAHLSR